MRRSIHLVVLALVLLVPGACRKKADDSGTAPSASASAVAAADSAAPATTQDPDEPVSPEDAHKAASHEITKANYEQSLDELENEVGSGK